MNRIREAPFSHALSLSIRRRNHVRSRDAAAAFDGLPFEQAAYRDRRNVITPVYIFVYKYTYRKKKKKIGSFLSVWIIEFLFNKQWNTFLIEIDLLKVVRSPFNRAGSLLFSTFISLFSKSYILYKFISAFIKVGFPLAGWNPYFVDWGNPSRHQSF